MTTQRLLLSVVPILLTSPAWASLCANQDSCAGQGQTGMDQALGEVGGCSASCRLSGMSGGSCIGACMGTCQSACGQPPLSQSQVASVLYAQMQAQLCYGIGMLNTNCGMMLMMCPMSLGSVQIRLP